MKNEKMKKLIKIDKNIKKTQKINKKSSKIGLYIRAILKIVIFSDFL